MILVGELALWVALLMAAWGAIVSFAGAGSARPALLASGIRALYATCACVILTTIGLLVGLLTSDFSLAYVAEVTSANLPVAYKLVALWAGQPGAMLFSTLLVSMCAAIAAASNRTRNRAVMPYIAGTLSSIALVFLALVCFAANPYERLSVIPADGRGMNPLLQHPGMAVHPPVILLGFFATVVPFAFVVATLLQQRLDQDCVAAMRRWSRFAWLVMAIGIITGTWWTYVEPGSRGVWAWFPVGSWAVLPWLATTVFVASVLRRGKRPVSRASVIVPPALSFPLAMAAVFLSTRGIISLRGPAGSSTGDWAPGVIIGSMAGIVWLIATRLRAIRIPPLPEDEPRGETGLLSGNFLLVTMAFSLMWGTLFPIWSAASRDEPARVPLWLWFVVLTALVPVIAWRRMPRAHLRRHVSRPLVGVAVVLILSLALGARDPYVIAALGIGAYAVSSLVQETLGSATARRGPLEHLARHRRAIGGYLVRLGVILLAIAFAGFPFRTESEVSLGPGESVALGDPYGRRWTFASQGVSDFAQLNRRVVGVALQASHENVVVLVRSERRQHVDSRGLPSYEPSTEPGIDYSFRQDIYAVLTEAGGDRATLRIAFNPLVTCVWIGAAIIAVGGTLAMGARPSRNQPVFAHADRSTRDEPLPAPI